MKVDEELRASRSTFWPRGVAPGGGAALESGPQRGKCVCVFIYLVVSGLPEGPVTKPFNRPAQHGFVLPSATSVHPRTTPPPLLHPPPLVCV